MQRYSITLGRVIADLLPRNNTLGTDAYNAISTIPGVFNVDIKSELEESVVITYEFHLENSNKFLETNEHFIKFGLRRIELTKETI